MRVYIIEDVPYGDLVRSVQRLLHEGVSETTRGDVAQWFRSSPLDFGFTGFLFPWETTAFFATEIGTEIPRSFPLIGGAIMFLLRGGAEVNGETLTRLFALHVVILPFVALLIVWFHLLLNQLHGISKSIGAAEKGPPIPFVPTFVRGDWLTGWSRALPLLQ
jgi:cytochrome b6